MLCYFFLIKNLLFLVDLFSIVNFYIDLFSIYFLLLNLQ